MWLWLLSAVEEAEFTCILSSPNMLFPPGLHRWGVDGNECRRRSRTPLHIPPEARGLQRWAQLGEGDVRLLSLLEAAGKEPSPRLCGLQRLPRLLGPPPSSFFTWTCVPQAAALGHELSCCLLPQEGAW